MITKNEIKFVRSLKIKKNRIESDQFIVEGEKIVDELIDSSLELVKVYSTSSKYESLGDLYVKISKTNLLQISNLKTPNKVVAIFRIPKPNKIDFTSQIVALDNISDPGNLGTIIRLCDWFGIKDLLCNTETVDCYNPKVVQASMGSISRVNISYLDFKKLFIEKKLNLVAADLKGESMNKFSFQENQIVVFGNESLGLSPEIKEIIKNRVTIPRYNSNYDIESINVANSVAIILAELKNRSTGR
ncbi:MAG: RNA methyltransferase [Pelagibacterales bacterium]|nr:RNA methyltransferase [Pelagibacterales bacterium]